MIAVLPGLILALAATTSSAAPTLPTARATIHIHLNAPAARSFPLFDPVNESRWNPDWHPTLLGDGKVASGLVFTTDDDGLVTWLLDRYDPAAGVMRYVNVRKNTLTTIDITVADENATASTASVTYTRTALTEKGILSIETFARLFPTQGPHWESAINAALAADQKH